MSVPKPLSYSSVKSILQHIDPNLRIQISERCPSLRTAEKSTPMALQHLEIDTEGEDAFEVLESYRGQTFITDDINRFGLANYTEDDILTEGDLKIPGSDMEVYRKTREAVEEDMRERTELLAEAEEGDDVSILVPNVQYGLRFSVWDNGTMLREEEMEKEPSRIRHALTYLGEKLFGGRAELFVRYFMIHDNPGVYRLPRGFRVRIRKLEIQHNASAVLNAIAPIIDKRSFPLKHILIDGYLKDINAENFVHPHIENAKMCTIAQEPQEDSDDLPPRMRIEEAMLATRCKIVVLDCSVGEFREVMVRNILDRLLTASPPRKIHLRLPSENPTRGEATHIMLEAMHGDHSKQLGRYWCAEFPTAFIFQLDSSTKLVVYCMRNIKYKPWDLHFNVVTKERYIWMKMQQL